MADDVDTEDTVRAIGEVTGDHGNPLFVGVYRGRVNVAGVHLAREGLAALRELLDRAEREAAAGE